MSGNLGKDSHASLSEREKSVLALAAEGKIDKEIALELDVSLATVRTYWDRLRVKLQALNRAHAVILGRDKNESEKIAEEMAAFVLTRMEDITIFACDEDGTLLSWNQGVYNVFGYTEEEWVGQHSAMFFLPEEKEEAIRELKMAHTNGASVNDRWHIRADGTRFWGTNTVINFEPPKGRAAYSKIVRVKDAPTEMLTS